MHIRKSAERNKEQSTLEKGAKRDKKHFTLEKARSAIKNSSH